MTPTKTINFTALFSDVPTTLCDICPIKNDLSSATTTLLCLPLFHNKSLEKTLFSSRNFFRIYLVFFSAFNKCENLFDNLVYFMYCAAVLIFIFTKWEFSICQDGLSVRFLTDNFETYFTRYSILRCIRCWISPRLIMI